MFKKGYGRNELEANVNCIKDYLDIMLENETNI